ncbi:MAG: TIGR00730 family Rossman fold protein [Patescibacteria group bacterium]
MNIAVFCSQYDVAEKYRKDAETLARLIAKGGHTLVFGGFDEGLMGVIADTAHRAGGRVVGIISERIKDSAYKLADEMVVVRDTLEMNRELIGRGDVIVVLVGGIGTLNELTDVLRMKKNGLLDGTKHIVIVNTDGFYEKFKEQLEKMNAEGFLKKEVMDAVHFADTPEAAMRYIEHNGN